MAQSGSSNKKVANSLVAVSASAVLAVYAAGYTRTQAAAEKLDAQSAERRPVSPEGRGSVRSAPITAEHHSSDSAPAVYDWAHDQGNTPTQTASIAYPAAPVTASAETAAPAATASAPAMARPSETPVAAPDRKPVVAGSVTPLSTVTPSPAIPEPAVTAPATTTVIPPAPPAVSQPAPQPAPPAAPQAAPKWKDGTYTGWGTSRHGDIQAAVVIESGRITSATIAQCLTRYSCNVIAMLPPEVVQRQSSEVDYVSGATQSTNAFYYAVVEALGKAK